MMRTSIRSRRGVLGTTGARNQPRAPYISAVMGEKFATEALATSRDCTRIGDYAIIGNCRAAALVSRAGSIDWLCWPRFDSPSLFGALLDAERGGCWRIAPRGEFRVTRAYLPDTNVLRTRFEQDSGALELTDAMTALSDEDKREVPVPEHEIVRLAECTRGEIELEVVFDPRPRYGLSRPALRDAGTLGLRAQCGAGVIILRSTLPHTLGESGTRAQVRLRAGEALDFSLSYAREGPALLPPLGARTREVLARTARWWKRWASRADYDGPYLDAVRRSALVLKLMDYAPSGAIVAAPTTSLPERIGGPLNWDYRYCWLRDAALTARALFTLGYAEEADAYVSWLLHATRLTRPRLHVLYDVYGERPRAERELAHLHGYGGSRPVRVGNAAVDQMQLDVYGEVIDAVARSVREGRTIDRETGRMLSDFGEYVCRHWDSPDEGIWEPRSGRKHHTLSRVLCWVALDRLLEVHHKGAARLSSVARFEQNRAAIRHEVETRGWNARLGSYVATLDGDTLDASLLLLAWYGFEDARSPRMVSTLERIDAALGAGDGLLYRYRGPDSPGEGAFGICSFWAVDVLARGCGTLERARTTFERLLGYANDVGLYAEEIDPTTGEALGNFPQAFTHVGLINAALSIREREERDAVTRRPPDKPRPTREAEVGS